MALPDEVNNNKLVSSVGIFCFSNGNPSSDTPLFNIISTAGKYSAFNSLIKLHTKKKKDSQTPWFPRESYAFATIETHILSTCHCIKEPVPWIKFSQCDPNNNCSLVIR